MTLQFWNLTKYGKIHKLSNMWVELCVTWLGYEADFAHANLIALPAAS